MTVAQLAVAVARCTPYSSRLAPAGANQKQNTLVLGARAGCVEETRRHSPPTRELGDSPPRAGCVESGAGNQKRYATGRSPRCVASGLYYLIGRDMSSDKKKTRYRSAFLSKHDRRAGRFALHPWVRRGMPLDSSCHCHHSTTSENALLQRAPS